MNITESAFMIRKLEDRWSLLKQRLEKYSAKQYCEDDGPCTGEFRAGFDRALSEATHGWVDSEIEKLEKK